MNAIEVLINEHDKVRATLQKISDSSQPFEKQKQMFENLSSEIIRHEQMEHTVWYPHFKNDKRLNETVHHLLIEENHAEKAIKKLSELNSPSTWDEHFEKFKTDVEHHAKEEEKELFPEVKKILSQEQLEKIGIEMNEFKKQYKD
ncbi:MAG: hemerythrin domain-containing protein [Tatlockia sp.]|nr:hemerythrin domain-containing protein [Tatlockia sp.]